MEYRGEEKVSNKPEPVVTVIVITYNHAKFISECLDSVLSQQTTFTYEVIIGEDDSNDGTRDICIEYANRHTEKIRLFLRNEAEKVTVMGVKTGAYNFSECLKSARGKYIAICEGDDYWTCTTKLQTQVDFLKDNNDYAICFHNSNVINTKRGIPAEVSEYQDFVWCGLDRNVHDYTVSDLISSPLCPTASIVFRKPEFFTLPEWYFKIPSTDMALLILVCGSSRIKYMDEFWSVYRKREGGISSHHRGDYIHKGRVVMFLALLEHFNGEFESEIKCVIKSHLKEVDNWSEFSSSEMRTLYKLFPIFLFIGNLKRIF